MKRLVIAALQLALGFYLISSHVWAGEVIHMENIRKHVCLGYSQSVIESFLSEKHIEYSVTRRDSLPEQIRNIEGLAAAYYGSKVQFIVRELQKSSSVSTAYQVQVFFDTEGMAIKIIEEYIYTGM